MAIALIGVSFVIYPVLTQPSDGGTTTTTPTTSTTSTSTQTTTTTTTTTSTSTTTTTTSGGYSLTVQADSGGTTNPSPGTYNHDEGTTVTVSANPSTDFSIEDWTLDGDYLASQASSQDVLMDSNHVIKAWFTYTGTQVKLLVGTNTGGYTKMIVPNSIDPISGSYYYDANTTITLEAIPTGVYLFDYWDVNGQNMGNATQYTFTLTSNTVITPQFLDPSSGLSILGLDLSSITIVEVVGAMTVLAIAYVILTNVKRKKNA